MYVGFGSMPFEVKQVLLIAPSTTCFTLTLVVWSITGLSENCEIRKRDGMTFLRSGGHAPTENARARDNMLHARNAHNEGNISMSMSIMPLRKGAIAFQKTKQK